MSEGRLFSADYAVPRAAPPDSDRFRLRLATAYELNSPAPSRPAVADAIKLRLGVQVPFGYGGYLYSEFFREAELRDVLDAITIIFDVLTARYGDGAASTWRSCVERTFRTERLPYRIDLKGGVHRIIDDEHERARAATLAVLDAPRYTAVADTLEKGFRLLSATRPDSLNAVKQCFFAAQVMAQMFCRSNDALDRAFVEAHLRPLVGGVYGPEMATAAIAADVVSGFADWVDGVMKLEAAGNAKSPLVLADEIAVLLVGNGAAYIRWLAQLDQRSREKL
jgi:hypothetical protein